MLFGKLWKSRWLGVPYHPQPDDWPFLLRTVVQEDDELVVKVAVLDDRESARFFGVPLARRGIQPVWLQITNKGKSPYRLRLASLDPGYFPPLEAAYLNHFAIIKRLLGFGLLAWWFFPLVILLPFKVLSARASNRAMNAYFQEHAIGWGLIRPGAELSGFVFTSHDEGTKQIPVRLLSATGAQDFPFSIPVPGLKVDHGSKRFDGIMNAQEVVECNEAELRTGLEKFSRCTTNRKGTREGNPLNLVAIGDFDTILNGFGARWDETETISFQSCRRTVRAFLLGSPYPYSPVSPLYVSGRSQDFALQKARKTINQRLHLRLWITSFRFRGKPVWIGQVSRDIGVRFTGMTWNLTTHKIDPDVDDARDYVLDDLLESGRVSLVGYVAGAEVARRETPRHNLTGDPYFTDGLRAVAMFSESRTTPTFLNWV
jgi:LssY C-terminus